LTKGTEEMKRRFGYLAAYLSLFGLVVTDGCGYTAQKTVVNPNPPASIPLSWQPALTPTEVTMIQQTFPEFVAEVFAPGTQATNRSNANLNPNTFYPAQFYGVAKSQGFRSTPSGFLVETNGFDQLIPAALPANGVYVGPSGASVPYALGQNSVSPINLFRLGRHLPLDPNAPSITIDDSQPQPNLANIDALMLAVQSQLATVFPTVANVSPTTCHIVLTSTIFTEQTGNDAPTYIEGAVLSEGATTPTIYVTAFYISAAGNVSDWQTALAPQAVNFYLASIGNPTTVRSGGLTAQLSPLARLRSLSSDAFQPTIGEKQ
jgi:hypothetical protein